MPVTAATSGMKSSNCRTFAASPSQVASCLPSSSIVSLLTPKISPYGRRAARPVLIRLSAFAVLAILHDFRKQLLCNAHLVVVKRTPAIGDCRKHTRGSLCFGFERPATSLPCLQRVEHRPQAALAGEFSTVFEAVLFGTPLR